MSAGQPLISERFVCPKCAGVHGVHFLTCPTLRLPQDVPLYGKEGGA
jgi:hypothetical protein